tara:strand:- start:216 stop:659 length:444 start_codon:yes stop_codon:yes gene_type:complete
MGNFNKIFFISTKSIILFFSTLLIFYKINDSHLRFGFLIALILLYFYLDYYIKAKYFNNSENKVDREIIKAFNLETRHLLEMSFYISMGLICCLGQIIIKNCSQKNWQFNNRDIFNIPIYLITLWIILTIIIINCYKMFQIIRLILI